MKQQQLRYQSSRRRFLKQTGGLSALAATGATLPISSALASPSSSNSNVLRDNPLGFNGVRQDPVTKLYPLGHGYRMYSPTLMRFNAQDSLSPFGRGGVNGYAYCLGDPINRHDPSGHIALLSLLIGAIVGAVVGAAVSAAAEGIQMAINPEHKFDWKQVGIGAALGFISGGLGASAVGAKAGVQVGLAVTDAVVSGAADFGLNVAAGTPAKQAAINAGIGAALGFGTFGSGKAFQLGKRLRRPSSVRHIQMKGTMRDTHLLTSELFTFEDTYKGKRRLNIGAHGEKVSGVGKLVVGDPLSNSGYRHMEARELIGLLSSQYKLSDYDGLRTIVCFSADGGNQSFGAQLAQATGKPVKSFSGTVTGNFGPEGMNDLFNSASSSGLYDGLRGIFAAKHTFRVDKVNPHYFYQKDYWSFSYKPIYF